MVPHQLLPQMPASLRPVLYGFSWDLDRLLALQLPRMQASVRELDWHLDLPYWRDERGRPFRLAPRTVWRLPDRHPQHHARTLAADLPCPSVVRRAAGRTLILDGVHRLLKAAMNGQDELPARLPHDAVIPAILTSDVR
jgi:hypothetical protein